MNRGRVGLAPLQLGEHLLRRVPAVAGVAVTFQARRSGSGGSMKTVMSKQARMTLVCSGSRPSTMTYGLGSTSSGRVRVPSVWSYTGFRIGSPRARC